jgi:hypothetical protein
LYQLHSKRYESPQANARLNAKAGEQREGASLEV